MARNSLTSALRSMSVLLVACGSDQGNSTCREAFSNALRRSPSQSCTTIAKLAALSHCVLRDLFAAVQVSACMSFRN